MKPRFFRTNDIDWEVRIRLISAAVLLVVALFLWDLFADYLGWFSPSHFYVEVVSVIFLFGLLIYLVQLLMQFRRDNLNWEERAGTAEEDANKWREEVKEIAKGLSHAIDNQFDLWKFTKAEKEIGMLMLKGLAFREVAQVRSTSERTVRQQSLEIYKKSGVSGRTEFSAFFLEDLLLPIDTNSGSTSIKSFS